MKKSPLFIVLITAFVSSLNNMTIAEQMCSNSVPCLIDFNDGIIDPSVITFLKPDSVYEVDDWLQKPNLSVLLKDNKIQNEDIIVMGKNKSNEAKYTLFNTKKTCELAGSQFTCLSEELSQLSVSE